MGVLKQGAAVTIKVGPFVDATDAVTPETGLTIPRGDVLLSKNGGAFAQKAETSAASHDAGGWYAVALNATDTGTAGVLTVSIQAAGALPFFAAFDVLHAEAYDMLFVDGPETGADVAEDVRAELADELDRIDVDVSSRSTLTAGQVRTELATELARIDADVSSRSTLTAANVRTELSTELARIDANISTRSTLNAAGVRDALGVASPNLDTQLGAVPTTTQLNARTRPTAEYATAAAQADQATADDVLDAAEAVFDALTNVERSGTNSGTLTMTSPKGASTTLDFTATPGAPPITKVEPQ